MSLSVVMLTGAIPDRTNEAEVADYVKSLSRIA
jgi:hypothetical protein